MRGLAFPSDAVFNRETSYEYGTPISNADDIPIDPVLTGVIDPALMGEGVRMDVEQPPPETQYPQQQQIPPQLDRVQQYSQGPQGDPFAPQVIGPYIPIEPIEPPPPVKPKRKRRVRREEECGFCQGNDERNKIGEPETMVTCHECGRSGHPSCMELDSVGDVLRSYPWRCIECKICELCHEKGDDEQILFCDCCDRGWHMYCFNPPITEMPTGKWHCPECPPLENGQLIQMGHAEMIPVEPYMQPKGAYQLVHPTHREASVASTSQSALAEPEPTQDLGLPSKPKKGRPKGKGKGKVKPIPGVEEAVEDDGEIDMEEVVVFAKSRRPRSTKRVKVRAAIQNDSSDGEPPSSPVRQIRRKRPREPSPPAILPRVRLRLPTQKGKGKERVEEEPLHDLFDDILNPEDRDTTKTTVYKMDKALFERSRIAAEEKLNQQLLLLPTAETAPPEVPDRHSPGPSRPLRSATLQHISTAVASSSTPLALSASPGPSTPGGPLRQLDPSVLRIRTIRFGEFDIKTWYDAPFPEEYASIPDGRLWICEFCLKYMKSRFGAVRHRVKCKARHPPGDEIYRDGAVSIFEVDGRRNKIYCQNLCLLSKMFLDHKSLFYDVEPFLFYVITEVDDFGARFVGYFSKEKRSPKDYNVSCIMTLPVRQRQGWGNLLIDFSYLLSKKEERVGSPEKPLSSLGAIGYRKYWTLAVMRHLEHAPDNVRIEDISAATSMTPEDICETLIQQNMIYIREPSPPVIKPSPGQAIKFPKGRKNGVARRQLQRMQTQDKDVDAIKGPFVPPKYYEIRFDREKVASWMRDWESKGYLQLKQEKLQWTPYLLSRAPKKIQEPAETPKVSTPTQEPSTPSTRAMDGDEEAAEFAPPLELFSPPPEANAEPDELPVIEDKPQPRTRTRSPVKYPSKTTERRPSPEIHDEIEAHAPGPPLRRLRSRQSYTSNQSSSTVPSVPSDAGSARKRRGRPPRAPRATEVVDADGALAAKLALEEQKRGGRQLRSRRSGSHLESKVPAVLDELPTATRKRRRIESPSEQEEDSGSKSTIPNGLHSNGQDRSFHVVPESLELNGFGRHQTTSLLDSEPTAMETVSDDRPDLVVDQNLETEIKSEDGIHLKNRRQMERASGQEIVYSMDDIHIDVNGIDKTGNGFTNLHRPLHAESDLRSTLGPPEEEYYDEDADAEGEYEEDAEGEPDVELLGC